MRSGGGRGGGEKKYNSRKMFLEVMLSFSFSFSLGRSFLLLFLFFSHHPVAANLLFFILAPKVVTICPTSISLSFSAYESTTAKAWVLPFFSKILNNSSNSCKSKVCLKKANTVDLKLMRKTFFAGWQIASMPVPCSHIFWGTPKNTGGLPTVRRLRCFAHDLPPVFLRRRKKGNGVFTLTFPRSVYCGLPSHDLGCGKLKVGWVSNPKKSPLVPFLSRQIRQIESWRKIRM